MTLAEALLARAAPARPGAALQQAVIAWTGRRRQCSGARLTEPIKPTALVAQQGARAAELEYRRDKQRSEAPKDAVSCFIKRVTPH